MSVPSPTASQVAVPPGWIAFDRYDTAFGAEGPYMGTMIIRPDGTDERSFSVPLTSFGLGAAWSRDGEQFVVNTWTEADQGVRPGVVDVDGSDFAKLVPDGVDGDFGCSDWNPDGNTLLCAMSGIDPDVDGIYTMRIDDLHLERLTTSPFHFTEGSAGMCGGGENRAVYSPDGTRIAYIRQRCGLGANPSADESAAIDLMASDGTDQRELVEQGKVKSHPGSQISWSPDGTSIAFGSQEGDLFLVDVETGAVTPIPCRRRSARTMRTARTGRRTDRGWCSRCSRTPRATPSSTRSHPMAATSARSRRVEVRSTGPAGVCLRPSNPA